MSCGLKDVGSNLLGWALLRSKNFKLLALSTRLPNIWFECNLFNVNLCLNSENILLDINRFSIIKVQRVSYSLRRQWDELITGQIISSPFCSYYLSLAFYLVSCWLNLKSSWFCWCFDFVVAFKHDKLKSLLWFCDFRILRLRR